MSKILGIDLGTTNSCMAVMDGGEYSIIPNSEGNRTTPSVIALTKNGDRLVGQAAKRQAVTNPKNTVFSVKRFMGMKFDDAKSEIEKVPYEVVRAPNGDAAIKIGDKTYSPPEVSSFILQKLKADAEAYLGEKITQAVITVPAYFNDAQRQATKDAGKIAGLEVLRIVNEPTAASLAYGLDKKSNETIAVFDFGGGTFDISILEIGDGVFEVKATNGDTHLGGDDIDNILIDWIVSEFKKESGIDLSKDQMALQRLKEAAEKAKCELSSASTTDISLPFITADATGPKHLQMQLTRAKFEQLITPVIDRLVDPCKKCIEDANAGKIDEVVLVGGSTRIPMVVETANKIFGIQPNKGVNPDEVVGAGAAIQGGILKGEVKDVLLLDVTPLDLGIETLGGINTVMIPRNTTIPTKKSETFSTAADGQPAITVRLCQGNRKMFNDNKLLGEFNLDGIPPAPRGIPQEEITVDIDANGIITVSAKDKGTGKEQHITITSSSGLTKEEIEKAAKDAELHEAEDKAKAELIETKNHAESMCFQLEKQMKDNFDKIDEGTKKDVESKINLVRESIKSDNKYSIEESMKSLQESAMKIGEKIYGQGSGAQPNFSASDLEKMMKEHPEMFKNGGPFAGFTPGQQPPPQNNSESKKPSKDDVIDAEIVE